MSAGKYTIGLGQLKMAFAGDREDVNSIALTGEPVAALPPPLCPSGLRGQRAAAPPSHAATARGLLPRGTAAS